MPANQDGSGYGQFGAPRRQGPTIASKKGALAIVIRSIGTDHHRNPHTGVMSFTDGAKPIPAGALSIPDAEQLVRILKRGQPVRDAAGAAESAPSPGQSGNVIAEVPGRDPSLPPVLVGGHLDSWDQGTGAIDDGAGVAIAAAAAKRIMDAGRPLRTIRIVWFGAEEVGPVRRQRLSRQIWQAAASCADRKRLRRRQDLEGRQQARRCAQGRSAKRSARRWRRSASSPASSTRPTGRTSARCSPTAMPGVGLSQDGTRYFDLHHTPDDTLDKIDPAQLRQNVAAWTAVLAVLSGGIEEPKARKRR